MKSHSSALKTHVVSEFVEPPLFSVIIPAYNSAGTIEDTVKSVLAQTISDLEIIVVDDGSKDTTVEVTKSLAVLDNRVRIITQPNAGASSARNTGIKGSRGTYVAFLDSDDLWLPQKLEQQLAVFNSDQSIDAVLTGAFYVNNDLEILKVIQIPDPEVPLLGVLLFQDLSPFMATLAVKRTVFDAIGPFDTELVILEDWELALRLARFCHLRNVEEPLALYRQFPGNRSKNWRIHIEPGHIVLRRLFDDSTLPLNIRKRKASIYAAFYTMLSGGAYSSGDYFQAIKWGIRAMLSHPAAINYIVRMPLRRLESKTKYAASNEFMMLVERLKKGNAKA